MLASGYEILIIIGHFNPKEKKSFASLLWLTFSLHAHKNDMKDFVMSLMICSLSSPCATIGRFVHFQNMIRW